MKLYINDNGDPSVGIFGVQWEIECPFDKSDSDQEEIEDFRKQIEAIYAPYCQGRMWSSYDFEQQREIDEEIELSKKLAAIDDDYDGRDYDNEAKQYQDDMRESDAPTPYDP